MIRVFIGEDSPVQAELLSAILEKSRRFEIVGMAADGLDVVAQVGRLLPDIVLMDCHMPGIDGLEATRRIMAATPVPIVVCSASRASSDVAMTFDALEAGALAVVEKPHFLKRDEFERLTAELVSTLRLMADVKVVRRRQSRKPGDAGGGPVPEPRLPPVAAAPPIRLIAIAGSTGAPGVIAEMLAGIREPVPPIAIVQHMAPGFADGMAAWLAGRTGMAVQIARRGDIGKPGTAYLAPDGAHLAVDRDGRFDLLDTPPIHGFKPSATVLFQSAARMLGSGVLAVVLTGMGSDGADGLLELRRAGAVTVAQDEGSAVVFGMPRAAVALDAAAHVLPPDAIARLIAARASGGWRGR